MLFTTLVAWVDHLITNLIYLVKMKFESVNRIEKRNKETGKGIRKLIVIHSKTKRDETEKSN